MKTITISSLRGGQGKTTISLFLGRLLARNHRVLLVDADPQADLTLYSGVEIDPSQPSLLEVIQGTVQTSQAIYPSVLSDRLFVIPSDDGLNQAQQILASSAMPGLKLRQCLKSVRGYDVCIIDSPPQGQHLSLSAICAADVVIIPAEVRTKGAYSVIRTLDVIEQLQQEEAFRGSVLGIVPFRDRWFGHRQAINCKEAIAVVEQVASARGVPLLKSIPESETFSKAKDGGQFPDEFQPIFQSIVDQLNLPVTL